VRISAFSDFSFVARALGLESAKNGASRMKIPTKTGAFGAILFLGGCMQLQLSGITDMSATDEELRPPDAEPGACYGKEIAPAVIETVTQQVLVRAATYGDDGTLVNPAAYRTETVQKIVQERADIWFKTPCADVRVDAFNASLQRALKVRGIYRGKITGEIDLWTRRAVRRYQKPLGLDSGTLSLASARTLGLVAVEREQPTTE
jgi:putative peptidoglycan binding protein